MYIKREGKKNINRVSSGEGIVHLLSTYSVPVSEAIGNKKSVAAAPRGSQAGGEQPSVGDGM